MVVENGTGMNNANSYVSLEYADDYFSVRSEDKWETLDISDKEVVLIKATDYIDNVFIWTGRKVKPSQSLRFPRIKLYDYEGNEIEGVPNCLKDAVCECALLIVNGASMYQKLSDKGDVVSENIEGKLSFTYDVSKKIKDSSLYESITYRLRGMYLDTSKPRIIEGTMTR